MCALVAQEALLRGIVLVGAVSQVRRGAARPRQQPFLPRRLQPLHQDVVYLRGVDTVSIHPESSVTQRPPAAPSAMSLAAAPLRCGPPVRLEFGGGLRVLSPQISGRSQFIRAPLPVPDL